MPNKPTKANPKARFPCKDCKERAVGCHIKCEKYLERKKELDEAKGGAI